MGAAGGVSGRSIGVSLSRHRRSSRVGGSLLRVACPVAMVARTSYLDVLGAMSIDLTLKHNAHAQTRNVNTTQLEHAQRTRQARYTQSPVGRALCSTYNLIIR